MFAPRFVRKGSGVVFGEAGFHVVDRCPKTTPDPVDFDETRGGRVHPGLGETGPRV